MFEELLKTSNFSFDDMVNKLTEKQKEKFFNNFEWKKYKQERVITKIDQNTEEYIYKFKNSTFKNFKEFIYTAFWIEDSKEWEKYWNKLIQKKNGNKN